VSPAAHQYSRRPRSLATHRLTLCRSTKITAHSTALIAQDSDLRGDITVGSGCIVHPKAAILALGGPIVMGADCVVEETAVIVNRYVMCNDSGFGVGHGVRPRAELIWLLSQGICRHANRQREPLHGWLPYVPVELVYFERDK
jgi:hypothetical protein